MLTLSDDNRNIAVIESIRKEQDTIRLYILISAFLIVKQHHHIGRKGKTCKLYPELPLPNTIDGTDDHA
jgi:hypothetical protein